MLGNALQSCQEIYTWSNMMYGVVWWLMISRWDWNYVCHFVPFLSGCRSVLCSRCSEDLDIMELNQWMHASG